MYIFVKPYVERLSYSMISSCVIVYFNTLFYGVFNSCLFISYCLLRYKLNIWMKIQS